MFLHIGGDVIIPARDVIAIFDITTSDNTATSEFLRTAQEEGFIIDLIEGEKKSFILANDRIYLSPIASSTLRKRWEQRIIDDMEQSSEKER